MTAIHCSIYNTLKQQKGLTNKQRKCFIAVLDRHLLLNHNTGVFDKGTYKFCGLQGTVFSFSLFNLMVDAVFYLETKD